MTALELTVVPDSVLATIKASGRVFVRITKEKLDLDQAYDDNMNLDLSERRTPVPFEDATLVSSMIQDRNGRLDTFHHKPVLDIDVPCHIEDDDVIFDGANVNEFCDEDFLDRALKVGGAWGLARVTDDEIQWPLRMKAPGAFLVPSTTPGHHHLYLPWVISWERYIPLLLGLQFVGVLEQGYVRAALRRRATYVRTPWTRKSFDDQGQAVPMAGDDEEPF
jgi:hypothetical protein